MLLALKLPTRFAGAGKPRFVVNWMSSKRKKLMTVSLFHLWICISFYLCGLLCWIFLNHHHHTGLSGDDDILCGFQQRNLNILNPLSVSLVTSFWCQDTMVHPRVFRFLCRCLAKKTPQPRTITCGEPMGTHSNHHLPITSWWFQPIWKILLRVDYFPK